MPYFSPIYPLHNNLYINKHFTKKNLYLCDTSQDDGKQWLYKGIPAALNAGEAILKVYETAFPFMSKMITAR